MVLPRLYLAAGERSRLSAAEPQITVRAIPDPDPRSPSRTGAGASIPGRREPLMGSGPQLSLETKSRNGVACVAVRGELDMATARRLDGCLAPFENEGVSAIVLDLRGLTFIDSFGLRALLRARDRAEKNLHRVILVGANASARRLFEITRTEFLLDDPETADVLSRFVGSESRGTGQALAAVLNIDARVA